MALPLAAINREAAREKSIRLHGLEPAAGAAGHPGPVSGFNDADIDMRMDAPTVVTRFSRGSSAEV